MSKIIQSYLDERSVRDGVLEFLRLLSIVCPFLLMNDFRIAKQTNSVQRAEIL